MADLPPTLRRLTALARVVDPTVASNRLALLLVGVGAAVGAVAGADVASQADAPSLLSRSITGGIGAFLAWAIARELDPDRSRTARYAGFAALGVLVLGAPDLAAMLATLLAVRVVTRSTGMAPTPLDLAASVVLAWSAAGDPTGVIAAFGLAAALVWDTRLPVRATRASGLAGAVALGSAVIAALLGGALTAGWETPGPVQVVVFLAAIGAAARIRVASVTARGDVTGERLHVERVNKARVLTGIVLAGSIVWVGGPAIAALGGAWTAFIAAGAVSWRGRYGATATLLIVALLIGGCAAPAAPPAAAPAPSSAPVAAQPTPSPTPDPTPTASPTAPPPSVRDHGDAADLGADIVAAERAIRDTTLPVEHRTAWAHVQQAAYRELADHPAWVPAVAAAIPADLASAYRLNAEAQAELHALTEPRTALPNWTIVAPPPADGLLVAYRTAADEFGIDWTYLAAIHLIETRMGRIRGDSSAGAKGPMQFMPATWDAYGQGDVNDPVDAIRAAARYLVAHGAPDRMRDALWAYNHSDRYVTAVSNYAQVMQDDPRTYEAYHAWQVYYRLETGSVLLTEGWSG